MTTVDADPAKFIDSIMMNGAWSEDRVGTCENCKRGVGVGHALRENGSLFCSQDCYWVSLPAKRGTLLFTDVAQSVQLDVNNSRLKKRKTRRRRRRDGPDAASVIATYSKPRKRLVPVEIDNAMFAFHANVCNTAYSIPGS